MPARDEGLSLRVEAGGLLRLAPSNGVGAAIERADARYGYTVTVAGTFESVGTPEAWNEVRGLEGAFQPQLALGGMRIYGNSTVAYTRFIDNSGPSPFLQGVQAFQAHHIQFSNASLMASRVGSLHLHNWSADAPFGALSVTLVDDLRIEDCTLSGIVAAMTIALSHGVLRRCKLVAEGTALSLQHATVRVEDSSLEYGNVGVQTVHKPKYDDRPASLSLIETTVVGTGANATSALALVATALDVSGGELLSTRGPAINASTSNLTVRGSRIEGPLALDALDPASVIFEGNDVAAGAQPIQVRRTTLVVVVGDDGLPQSKVAIQFPGGQGVTNAAGRAIVTWLFAQGATVPDLNDSTPVPVRLSLPEGEVYDDAMPGNLVYAQFTIRSAGLLGAPAAGWLTGLAALGLAGLLWGTKSNR